MSTVGPEDEGIPNATKINYNAMLGLTKIVLKLIMWMQTDINVILIFKVKLMINFYRTPSFDLSKTLGSLLENFDPLFYQNLIRSSTMINRKET